MSTSHQFKNSIASRLYWQVNPVAKVLVILDGSYDIRVKVTRKRSGELNTWHFSRGNSAQKPTERSRTSKIFQPTFDTRAVAVHVLSNQVNFLVSERL